MTYFYRLLICLNVCCIATLSANAQQGITRPAISPAQAVGAPSSSAAVAPVVGSIGSIDPSTYRLAAQDSIQVTVYKEPSMSGSFPIRPDGMISLPLIGDVVAAGTTPMQLAVNITGRLGKFVQDPNVTVTVLSVQPKEIFLLGEIMRVGPVMIQPGMSLLQVISAAGGPTPYANAKRMYLLRTVNGKQTKIPFDYKKALKTGDMQGIQLIPGDTIVIP